MNNCGGGSGGGRRVVSVLLALFSSIPSISLIARIPQVSADNARIQQCQLHGTLQQHEMCAAESLRRPPKLTRTPLKLGQLQRLHIPCSLAACWLGDIDYQPSKPAARMCSSTAFQVEFCLKPSFVLPSSNTDQHDAA